MLAERNERLTSSCQEFCTAVGDLADARLAAAYCDTAHLGDVERMAVKITKTRHDIVSYARTGATGIMTQYAGALIDPANVNDDYPYFTYIGQAKTETGDLPGTLDDISDQGWVCDAPGGNPLWPYSGLDEEEINYAYVASNVRVTNLTARLYKAGASYLGPVPADMVQAVTPIGSQNIGSGTWPQYPFMEKTSGTESLSSIHIANVVDVVPETGTQLGQQASHTPKHLFMWTGTAGQNANYFSIEVTTLYYVWGPKVNAAQAPIRTPGLWACLRSAYSSAEWEPVTVASDGQIERAQKGKAKSLASRAMAFMAEHAEETLELGKAGFKIASAVGLL